LDEVFEGIHVRMEHWAARVKRLLINPEKRTPHWSAALFAMVCFSFVGTALYEIVQSGPPRPIGFVVPGIFLVMGVLALVPSTRYLVVVAMQIMTIMVMLVVAIYFAWSLLT
jgi:hypothetical protein